MIFVAHLMSNIWWFSAGGKNQSLTSNQSRPLLVLLSVSKQKGESRQGLGICRVEEKDGEGAFSKQEFRKMQNKLCSYIYTTLE